jgi:hypothetical protein
MRVVKPFGIDVAHLQTHFFTSTQVAGIYGGQTDAMIERSEFLQDLPRNE